MKLTSKERFKLALAHKEVDRPVIDFQAASEIREGLKNYFVVDDDKLLDFLQVDVRTITPAYIGHSLKVFPDGTREDIFGVRRKEATALATGPIGALWISFSPTPETTFLQ